MSTRINVALPKEMHQGLMAAGYSPGFLVRKLVSDFMAANNIPLARDNDESQKAA